MAGSARTIFNEIVCHLKTQNQHNTTTNLSFEGASRTPSWRDGWEDNEPTRGSKLHELTEIEGDDCPREWKSHCCGLLWSSAKMGVCGTYHTKISDMAQLVSSTAKMGARDHQEGGTYHTKTSNMVPLRWYL